MAKKGIPMELQSQFSPLFDTIISPQVLSPIDATCWTHDQLRLQLRSWLATCSLFHRFSFLLRPCDFIVWFYGCAPYYSLDRIKKLTFPRDFQAFGDFIPHLCVCEHPVACGCGCGSGPRLFLQQEQQSIWAFVLVCPSPMVHSPSSIGSGYSQLFACAAAATISRHSSGGSLLGYWTIASLWVHRW